MPFGNVLKISSIRIYYLIIRDWKKFCLILLHLIRNKIKLENQASDQKYY
jgi:hypothetical protein